MTNFWKISALVILLFSCNSKKRAMDKAIHEEKRNVSLYQQNDITTNAKVTRQANTITYTPINPDKPILVDGKEITNAKIVQKDETEFSETSQTDKSKTDKSEKTQTADKAKSVDVATKRSPWLMWVMGGVVLIVVICFALYFRRSIVSVFRN